MQFAFKPALTVATLIGLAILISLGTWQVQRLAWKEDLIARVEARTNAEPIEFAEAYRRWLEGEDMEYTPVWVQLVYNHPREAHVFGSLEGVAGWYVFTPASFHKRQPDFIDEDAVLYINRGFTADTFKARETRPDSLIAADENDTLPVVTGLLRTPQESPAIAGALTPQNDPARNEWYVRDPMVFAGAAGVKALPVWVDSSGSENPAAWPKGNTTRLDFNNRHLEYALTWFGLAATLLVVFFAFSLKRRDA
ncbi:SURF1 family protein [Parvularcula sp. IMCC14364]|uniref:SURF1 family protein n=1 Tax=Parvularcula sp. IMCC14364 TaxID=3067902 RepID=UPI002741AB12|nr:SURF1 family cytochrome oxidase biogenesis protein [Parvularcula sp. IMCC14364]